MKIRFTRPLLSFLIAAVFSMGVTVSSVSAEEPQYGGNLKIFPIYYNLNPMSWNVVDWHWKINQDVGLVNEALMAGDLQKGPRGTNDFNFKIDAWIPPNATKGELAESWEIKQNPLRVEFKIRKGIMWPAKKGVMKSRPLTAYDIAETYQRIRKGKKYPKTYWKFVDKFKAENDHLFVAYLNGYNANWAYLFGWGYHVAIQPKEFFEAGPQKWKNLTGTGPFYLKKYRKGSYTEFQRNKNYWDSTVVDGKSYKLPFVNKIKYLITKDSASAASAFRTGKVDLFTSVKWETFEELMKENPELKYSSWLYNSPAMIAMRVDTKPFDDIRVRQAVALAINRKEIADNYYGGKAEVFAYPFPPNWKSVFEPLSKMPKEVRELFGYNPDKAKKLLADAGYPDGFSMKLQVSSSNPRTLEVTEMVAAYLAKVGIKATLEPMAFGQHMSMIMKKKHSGAIILGSGHGNPLMVMRKNFKGGQVWNAFMFKDEYFDKTWEKAVRTADEKTRIKLLKELNVYILKQSLFVQIPAPYNYTMWWPWVKNYHGELRVGAERYGPIHARIWVDQKLKRQMGY